MINYGPNVRPTFCPMYDLKLVECMTQSGAILLHFEVPERTRFTMFGRKIIDSFLTQCITNFGPKVRPILGRMYDHKPTQCMTQHWPNVR